MNAPKVSEHIIKWLKEYAENAKVNGFVIGISGGIDSAVTSILCAKTGMKTLCAELPIYQAENQVIRGKEHISELKQHFNNVFNIEVNLTKTFDSFKQAIPFEKESDKLNLTLANTRSRLRMTTLYYFAGLHGLLVAGTGNKIEDFGVGFFTKYGDGGVDISPIADLVKSEVYELACYLGVSETILEAPPTDGLFGDDRTDEDQLGATYNELEWAMQMYDSGKTNTCFKDRELEVFKIYSRLHQINQHKINPIPICKIPKVLRK